MHNYIVNFSLTISHWLIYKYANIFIIVFIYNPINFIYALKKFILRMLFLTDFVNFTKTWHRNN